MSQTWTQTSPAETEEQGDESGQTNDGENGERTPIVVAEQIHKTFRNGEIEVHALRGVDLTIETGEMVAIMGPSGCGKTTLLNTLSGLDSFDGGQVTIEGTSLADMNDRKRTDYRAQANGVRLPVIQPAAGNFCGGECRDAAAGEWRAPGAGPNAGA